MVQTDFGPLRGRNPKALKPGDRAVLFIRPEDLIPVTGAADSTLSSYVTNVSFEGNMTHVYLNGQGAREISMSIGRQGGTDVPQKGTVTPLSYHASNAIVLPEGTMARE